MTHAVRVEARGPEQATWGVEPPSVVEAVGRFSAHFVAAYRRSLGDYRMFYDDVACVGDPNSAEHIFYYVPGIGGTPGQARLAIPSMTRVFGPRIHVRALADPGFGAGVPIWDRYTLPNIERKLQRLRHELTTLLDRGGRCTVVCSSNGLYDFLAAASQLPAGALEETVDLVWVSCAPDRYLPTRWEHVFFPFTGLIARGHRWFAYPNHDALGWINREATSSFRWREGAQSRRFHKADVESRFGLYGLQWDYVSISQLGESADYVRSLIARPWNGRADVLIAADDGYWQGTPIGDVIRRVLIVAPRARCSVRPGSHVSVVTPTHLTELFERVRAQGDGGA